MALLRNTDRSVTDVCFAVGFSSVAVGFSSLGTFQPDVPRHRRPVTVRVRRQASEPYPVPTCFTMSWTRPSSFGEAGARIPA